MIDQLLKKISLTSRLHREHIKSFIRNEAIPGSILDIGSNFYNKEQYHRYFDNVTTLNLAEQRGIAIDVIGSAYELPFADHSFDGVLCTEMIEHLETPQKAIDEMFRVLKPGGKVILSTPFVMPLHDVPGDYFRYSPYGLRSLFSRFESVTVSPVTTTFEALFIVMQRITYQSDWGIWTWMKLPFLVFGRLLCSCSFFVRREYGDINRTKPIEGIMSSGYFVTAYKPK